MLPCFDFVPIAGQGLVHDLPYRHRGQLELDASGFQPRDLEQVVDQLVHPLYVGVDDVDELLLGVVQFPADAHRQHLGVPLHSRHGLLELVRHKVDEF